MLTNKMSQSICPKCGSKLCRGSAGFECQMIEEEIIHSCPDCPHKIYRDTPQSEELKKEFEANFLDGDSVDDCGGATFTVSGVLDVLDFFLAKQQ